jgi:DNA repair exonuclease SbcCD ATPase subunit
MIDSYEKIDVGMDRVDTVMHLADIHIRLIKRHDEYREAFEKIYAYAKTLPKNSIIAILGDVLNAKCDLSPEAVQLTSEFLKNLADVRPVILTAGNHDCMLSCKTRLDSLSPIVNNLAHKNIHYFKKTGLYGVGNILFNNMSVFDDVTKYINIKKITKKIKNEFDIAVALFHGGVNGSLTDLGYLIENRMAPRDFFDGHDIVMLGDIHRSQTFYIERVVSLEDAEKFSASKESENWEVVDDDDLDEGVKIRKLYPIFRYSGSALQQNHGESLHNHGFSVWDIKARAFEHIEVQNDYGYFTIEIHDGKLVTDITDMPLKPKLRVKCKESVATEVKKVIAEIRKDRQISDLVYMRIEGADAKRQSNIQALANLARIGQVDYQNKLISEYLKSKYVEMDDDTLAEVHKINIALNDSLSKDDQSKNIRWKPIKFEFSNLFSYGENNVIDFTQLSDVYGLFSKNATGKSSLFNALCFTMFDKSATAYKASHVMNTQKMSFSGKFTFEINTVQYVIERKGTRDKKNNVKVDVNFYKLVNGEEVALNAEARRSTNEIIRDYLGTYDDFVLTTLALQGNQGSFIDMGQTERKELLSLFIGLTLFDRLVIAASEQCKDVAGAIKIFNKEDSTKKVADMLNDIEILSGKLLDLNEQKDLIGEKIKTLENTITENESLIVVLENVPSDVEPLLEEKQELLEKLKTSELSHGNIQKEIADIKQEHAELNEKLAAFGDIDLEEKFDQYTVAIRKKQRIEQDIDKLKTLVSEKLKKLAHLDKHEYDPKCVFCMNNIFVKDAIATRESLNEDRTIAKSLAKALETIELLVDELSPFVAKYETSKQLLERRTELSGNLARKELTLNNTTTNQERTAARLTVVEASIQLYERSKEVIETNHAIQKTLKGLTQELQKTEAILKKINADYVSTYSKKVSFTDQVALIKTQVEKIEKAEQEYAAYQYYLQAIGRDGIPYQIISDVVPKIEQEVNNILSQIVEFGLEIETDGKNVNVFIKYEDRKWPLELSSGMERFICALALRVALINISNLPRPNFMILDEGLSALDADNMAMVHALFDYLKTNFDFIIVISHLDSMRDMVDKQLEIKKESGFSKIDNSV